MRPASSPPARASLRARYEVVRRLGVSPSSEVLLAVARGPFGFERTVVLKRLALDGASGDDVPRGNARLGREALAYARLVHPAIVRLYDFVEDDGRLTLVLEHVDGLCLSRVVRDLAAAGETLDEASIWYIGYRIFLALAAGHSARDPMTRELATVIHRDVCPDNVLVGWDGYVKLSDFGVARVAGVEGDTRPGVVNGTIGYLAPEQVRGERATVRTDVYSGCLVLRELLLREPAFPRGQATDLELLGRMATPSLLPLAALRPGLPRIVGEAIDRGLVPDQEQRGVTAEEMVGLLRAVVDIESARENLGAKMARLRRAEDAVARTDAFATRPEIDTQRAVTSRPPPLPASVRPPPLAPQRLPAPPDRAPPHASMVVPRAPSYVPPPERRSYSPFPSAVLPISPRSLPAVVPPPPPRAATSVRHPPRTTSGMVFETPNAMTTPLTMPSARPREPRGRAAWMVVAAALAIGGGVGLGGLLGWREKLAARNAFPSPASDDRATHPVASPVVRAASGPASNTAPASTSPGAARAPAAASASGRLSSPPASSLPVASPLVPFAPAPSSTTGRLLTAPSEAGHRLFVDGRFSGAAGAPVTVRCGKHDVRVGSTGHLRRVEVPCGGELTVVR